MSYLFKRCAVKRETIESYLEEKKRQGIRIMATPLYIVARAYEHTKGEAPERRAARELRCSVSDVKQLRRKWGISGRSV